MSEDTPDNKKTILDRIIDPVIKIVSAAMLITFAYKAGENGRMARKPVFSYNPMATAESFANIEPEDVKLTPEQREAGIRALSESEKARINLGINIADLQAMLAAAEKVKKAEEDKQELLKKLASPEGGTTLEREIAAPVRQ